MSRPTVAEIDLHAFENNWKIISSLQPQTKLIPVLKANAYGHGAAKLSLLLQNWGVHQVAVALIEEAADLRRAGFRGDILILGPFYNDEVSEVQKWQGTPVIGDRQELVDLVKANFKGKVHVKWDTGMNRLGLSESDIPWFQQTIGATTGITVEAICSHFLQAHDLNDAGGVSEKQIQKFRRIEAHFPSEVQRHIFNTDGFFANSQVQRLPENYGARPGLSLYGYAGVSTEASQKLQPVMTLKTKIVHLTNVSKGQTVSYNGTWRAQRDSQVAVLPIGYADGYPRGLSNKGQVFVLGQRVPLVGMVCMDYLMIDVTDVNHVKIGDEVELWGKHISIVQLAQMAGTISYELMAALTVRVQRRVRS